MAQAAKHKAGSPQGGRHPVPSVEGMAWVSLHAISGGDMAQIGDILQRAGILDVRPTRVILTRHAAEQVASGRPSVVRATIVSGDTPDDLDKQAPAPELATALADATARGESFKRELLDDPGMLRTSEVAQRLGMSEEGVRLKRKRHELLGLELAKRGIRYPSWQIIEDQRLLPGLPRLFGILGPNPWTIYRFLQQHHAALGGVRAVDALRRGRIDAVMAAAESIAAGAFS